MLVHTPRAYPSTSLKYPVLIFLHGPAEAGDDLSALTSRAAHLYPPKLIATNKWDEKLPFIVVSPQLKKKSGMSVTSWTAAYIDDVVEFVKQHYRVDANRIYLTGVSAGATACWDYAATFPAKVAAIVPVSGNGINQNRIHPLKNIPVWAFHGEIDPVVTPVSAAESVNLIKSLNGSFTPRITILFAKGHGGWSELYSGASGFNIYQWLLRFQKKEKKNITPYVNAGPDRTIHQRPGDHVIAADFFDWDGKIAAIKWVQTSGERLSIDGANSAFLRIAKLRTGTFDFQISVTDNSGSTSFDNVRVEVVNIPAQPFVNSLVLIEGKTKSEFKLISGDMVIDKNIYDGGFNVKAYVSAGVQSVKYSLGTDNRTQISNAPFTLLKHAASTKWVPSNTTCVICATPYTGPGGSGEAGATFCSRVTFTQSTPPLNSTSEVPLKIRAIDDILVSSMASGNQWVYNGRDIPGATGPIFKPSSPGDYFVRQITRSTHDVSNLVKYGSTTAAPATARVDVFPNPAQGYIQVKADALPLKSSYRILRGGVTVQQGELYDDRKIALATRLPKGDYVLIINGKKDERGTKFVIR